MKQRIVPRDTQDPANISIYLTDANLALFAFLPTKLIASLFGVGQAGRLSDAFRQTKQTRQARFS